MAEHVSDPRLAEHLKELHKRPGANLGRTGKDVDNDLQALTARVDALEKAVARAATPAPNIKVQ